LLLPSKSFVLIRRWRFKPRSSGLWLRHLEDGGIKVLRNASQTRRPRLEFIVTPGFHSTAPVYNHSIDIRNCTICGSLFKYAHLSENLTRVQIFWNGVHIFRNTLFTILRNSLTFTLLYCICKTTVAKLVYRSNTVLNHNLLYSISLNIHRIQK